MKFNLTTVRRINIVVAGGISTAYIVGKAISVNSVKKNLELKKDGKALPVPPKLQSLIDEVTQDMKLDMKKYQIKPFVSKGSDVQHVAFPLFPEIYIGVPEYYMFDKDDKSQFTVMVNDKEIPQHAPEFTPLKQAMSLSTEAKKFGVAQGIIEAQHSVIGPCGVLPMLVVLNCCCMSYLLERYEKFTKKPLHPSNHYILFLFGAWMYAILFDIVNILKETESDFAASALGKSYAQGGIEYYQKMIKRNKIFKKLNKDAPYTEEGDINTSLIRTTHMPLDRRITYLRELSKGKKESVWTYILY